MKKEAKRISKVILSIALIFVCVMSIAFLSGCKTQKKYKNMLDGATLVWEDNFDILDQTKWGKGFEVEEGKISAPRKGGFWAYDATTVKDGNLIIRTDYRENGDSGAGWYTGAIDTEPKGGEPFFSKKYGYFEVRCKAPRLFGGWAAFWMMPIDNFASDKEGSTLNTAIDGAEIDIFESPFYYDKKARETINHAIHYDGYGDNLKSVPKTGIKVKDLYDEFHTYGLEWTEQYYRFYVDGIVTFEVENEWYKNADGKKVYQNSISQTEEYLLLSVEIVTPAGEGQSMGWCGDPSLNDKTVSYDFIVDYVRVYELK